MQKTLVFDDMDGETIATTTIRFSIDDDFLEIDLSDGHADEFTKAMSPFVAAARTYSPATSARKPGMSKEERSSIVEWAATQGIEIAPRGRIASDIVDKFKAAQEEAGHATVEKAMEAGEQSAETAPDQEPETPAEPTSQPRSRRRS
jgi:hypothetical protein